MSDESPSIPKVAQQQHGGGSKIELIANVLSQRLTTCPAAGPGPGPTSQITDDEAKGPKMPLKSLPNRRKRQSPIPLSGFVTDSRKKNGRKTEPLLGMSKTNRDELIKRLADETWIQCDDTNCHKWRRICSSTAAGLADDDRWFCRMNPDSTRNSCDCAEDDFSVYEKLMKRCGLRYVESVLAAGTIVWAKMTGYCKWPAIISPDPACDLSVTLVGGTPRWYHVEYFGEPHTHGWVTAKNVEPYGKIAPISEKSLAGRRKLRSKQTYKKQKVDSAMKEAESWIDLSTEERLDKTIFKENPYEDESEAARSSSEQALAVELNGQRTEGLDLSGQMRDGFPSGQMRNGFPSGQTKDGFPSEQTRDWFPSGQTRDGLPSEKTTDWSPLGQTKDGEENSTQISTINIQSYRNNEQAFKHDLQRFSTRRGFRTNHTPPKWQNRDISLCQLFLLVVDRGGYSKVTENRGWSKIFNLLTGSTQPGRGHAVKVCYTRHLLAYERYLTERRYTLTETSDVDDDVSSRLGSRQAAGEAEQEENFDKANALDLSDVDLDEMLVELETMETDCRNAARCATTGAERNQHVKICYHDDSPVPSSQQSAIETDTTLEFSRLLHQPHTNCHTTTSQDSNSNFYHVMQALEDDIDKLEVDLDFAML
ncbi:uncharacterized protein LOC141912193 [Tubulanus polymorphus]|uniref:uncharacterized protein LOC141912193 n=1 Tax=Tubulanus polymorphus TaxID=672921 RepID=UPI003DA3E264